MTKLSTFLLGIMGCLLYPTTAQGSSQPEKEDSVRNSVVGYLMKKKIPEVINVDLHLRSAFHAKFNSGDADTDEASFRFDHIMIGIYGNVTDKLSYKYLQRLNKGTQAFETENLSGTIDYAYLRYQLDPRFAVTAGRQALFVEGFEYNEYPINIYDYSGITNNITCYLTGVNIAYSPRSNQEIAIQVLNNRAGIMEEAFGRIPEGIERPFAPLYYSLVWNSNYSDNKVQLRYAASTGELAKGKWVFMIGGGQMVDLGKFNLFLDILYHRSAIDHLGVIRKMAINKDGTAWDGIARSVEYLTFVSEANYRFLPKWNIHLKGFYDRASVYKENGIFGKGNYLSSWGYQGGIEYFPMADKNLHLFLNATGKTYKNIQKENIINQEDQFRVSLGFVYRLPVL